MSSYFQLKVTAAEALTGLKLSAPKSDAVPSTAKIFAAIQDTTIQKQAQILNYESLADHHLVPLVENLVNPLSGKTKYIETVYSEQLELFFEHCGQLDKILGDSFLIGGEVSTADTTLAAALKPAFENLLGKTEREKFSKISEWYSNVMSQDSLKKHFKVNFIDTRKVYDAAELKKKMEKEAEKAQKKAEKEAKFAAKKAAAAAKKPVKKAESKPKSTKATVPEVVSYTEETAKGNKKSTTCELPKAYSPKYVEAAWSSWWEKEGFYKPEYGKEDVYADNPKGHFTIMIPPPNVTGTLHLGHALTLAVEDCITRWHRMTGKTTLWNPGCDHAGIATQVVVEKRLKKERNITRHQLGRDAFVEEVWKWKNEKGETIYNQIRAMGASVDWERAAFTMDPKLYKAVQSAFIRFHANGTIFRSNRLVNWSCALQSAISNIEVDQKELEGRTLLSVPGYAEKVEFGVLISFSYKLEDGRSITVATTRIETMLGDVAVAVNPMDERYSSFVGQKLVHPFIPDRSMIIVADDYVKVDFGSGAVKITPAHDHNDYDMGKRHDLAQINIFDDDGFVTGTGTKYDGMKRFDVRKQIVEDLKAIDQYVGVEDNPMVVPMCSRSKDIIEPLLKPQWYVDTKSMAKRACDVVTNGELKIIPESHEKTWFHWLTDSRPWCISRQLWWGHRIPAYHATVTGDHTKFANDDEYWVCALTHDEAMSVACAKFNCDPSQVTLDQDPDVLDTWFSSALYPMSAFGWPDENPELSRFYPGELLETGHDIIFFWVARMVMFSLALCDKIPFKEVYLHAMVRDAHGRKMSKSLGNVIDPRDVINGVSLKQLQDSLLSGNLDPKEIKKAQDGQAADYPTGIPECGTDALRFALCSYTSQGRDINLDVKRVEGYRKFCNKLWNAIRFAQMQLGDEFIPAEKAALPKGATGIDKWILSRLAHCTEICTESFKTYDFPAITTAVFNFWLYELCDVYLETVKPVMWGDIGTHETKMASQEVLYTCLDAALRLSAPFMPYVTEELWQRLPRRAGDTTPSIHVSSYPEPGDFKRDDGIESDIALMMDVVKQVRSLRGEYKLVNKQKTKTFLEVKTESSKSVLQNYTDFIQVLTNSEEVIYSSEIPAGCVLTVVNDEVNVHVLLKGVIDFEKELQKMEKTKKQLEGKIVTHEKKVNAIDYATKVPEAVQATDAEKKESLRIELSEMEKAIDGIRKMLL